MKRHSKHYRIEPQLYCTVILSPNFNSRSEEYFCLNTHPPKKSYKFQVFFNLARPATEVDIKRSGILTLASHLAHSLEALQYWLGLL